MITEALSRPALAACDVPGKLMRADGAAVEWIVSDGLTPYPEALAEMRARAARVLIASNSS